MGIIVAPMTIHTLRLRIRTFERGSVATESIASPIPVAREPLAPAEFDEDGRLYVFRFAPRQPERMVIDRDRIFSYIRRRRTTVDGRSVSLLPDMRVRSFLRDTRNRADFYTAVRELQTHPDVERYEPPVRIEHRPVVTRAPDALARVERSTPTR